MSLDTKQKRGSAVHMGLPFRRWLAEPDGTVAVGDRASLLKLCSSVASSGGGGGARGSVFRSPVLRGSRNG